MNKINKNDFDEIQLFSTPIYTTFDLESVELVKQVSQDPQYYEHNDTKMSGSFFHDERIFDFAQFVLQSSWNILKHQGYLMENYQTIYESMWLHTHEKHSYIYVIPPILIHLNHDKIFAMCMALLCPIFPFPFGILN